MLEDYSNVLEIFSPKMIPEHEKVESEIRSMLTAASVILKESCFKAQVLPLNMLQDVVKFYQCMNDGGVMIDERYKTRISVNWIVLIWWVLFNYLG